MAAANNGCQRENQPFDNRIEKPFESVIDNVRSKRVRGWGGGREGG